MKKLMVLLVLVILTLLVSQAYAETWVVTHHTIEKWQVPCFKINDGMREALFDQKDRKMIEFQGRIGIKINATLNKWLVVYDDFDTCNSNFKTDLDNLQTLNQ